MNENMIIKLIIDHEICTDAKSAIHWYRSVPIPSFSNQTAKQLVESGKTEYLVGYLKRITHGGYA